MIHKPIRPLLFFLSLLLLHETKAQVTLEVVTRTIEKILPAAVDATVHIAGENASIRIDSWDKNEVRIRMKLVTKHRIKAVAVAEMENIKYIIEKKGKDLFLRDYFMASENGVTGCILKVEYELTVPFHCNLDINNNLGDIDLKTIEGRVDGLAKFGNISIENFKGDLSIDLSLGDIRMRQIGGTSAILANHSHLDMEEASGRHKLKLINSDLSFHSTKKVELLQVEAKNGNIECSIPNEDEYNYDFSVSFGEIILPDALKSKLKQQPNKMQFIHKDVKNTFSLHIVSEFGNIILTK
jgi:DUF4097 and DUF4098 domain-containing protein YvlB